MSAVRDEIFKKQKICYMKHSILNILHKLELSNVWIIHDEDIKLVKYDDHWNS